MLYKFVFRALKLGSVALTLGVAFTPAAFSQSGNSGNGSAGDSLILDMNQAFRAKDKGRLAQLLPQARGHALEPWAAYWELKARGGRPASC